MPSSSNIRGGACSPGPASFSGMCSDTMMQDHEFIRPDCFLLQPGTRILLKSEDAMFIREHNGMLGLVDRQQNHVFYLKHPSYEAGLNLLTWPPDGMGVLRNALNEAAGFWLWRSMAYVAMVDQATVPKRKTPPWTLVLATPTTLQMRPSLTESWTPILGHHPKINPNA